jgi:hypothetical protein
MGCAPPHVFPVTLRKHAKINRTAHYSLRTPGAMY